MGMNLYAVLSRKKQLLDNVLKKISIERSQAYTYWLQNPCVRNKIDYDTYLVTGRVYLNALYEEADKISKTIKV